MEQNKTKPKRRIKNIDFSGDSSHIALVHKDQGGPASGADYKLILKSLDIESTEQIISEVQSQETESEVVAKATESDTSLNVHEVSEVSTSVITKNKESSMTKEVKVENTEIIEKSAAELNLELLQKSLDDSKVELQKAQELIAEFKKEKQELINKSKTAQFTAVIKDEKLQAPIVKAALSLESEDDFGAFLAAITAMQSSIETSQAFVEKSALFSEVGATVTEDNQVKESAVARILKAKQAK